MQHLDAIKNRLRAELPDKGISHVLKTLEGMLPSNAPKYDLLIALKSDYKKLKLEMLQGLLSKEEENRQQANLRRRVLELLRGLEPADFEKKARRSYLAPEQKIKKGHVLYRIPKQMQLEQESRCLVRIAFDKEMIVEDLDIDEDTELRSGVRISDYMKVEIVDPSPDGVFDIRTTSESVQLIDADDFTEWKFYVKPKQVGEHVLELKVNIMLQIDGEVRVREKTLEESVVIITQAPAPADAEQPWQQFGEELHWFYPSEIKSTRSASAYNLTLAMAGSILGVFVFSIIGYFAWIFQEENPINPTIAEETEKAKEGIMIPAEQDSAVKQAGRKRAQKSEETQAAKTTEENPEQDTELDLGGNDLTSLPPEIRQLKQQQDQASEGTLAAVMTEENPEQDTELDLRGIDLTSLPPEIGQLNNLTSLFLEDNQLKSLPPEIGQLTNLTRLDLEDNDLTSLPPEITQLTNLTELDLGGNRQLEFKDICMAFASFPKSIRIDADNKYASNEDENILLIKVDGGLEILPPEIGQLDNLTTLDLEDNDLTSLPPEIGQLTNLTRLDLDNNQLTSLPPEIGQLTNLTTLDLKGNQLKSLPPEIWQLTNLTMLDLSVNLISTLPSEIGQLVNLAELDMRNTLIPPEEYKKVKKLLPNCDIEYDSTSLRLRSISSLPPEIWQLTNLTELELLRLSSNDLTSLLPEIGQLNNLTELDLGWNDLTSLPPEIGQLTNLTELDLSYNELTSLPTEITQLNNLTTLDLEDNQLTSLPTEIGQLTKLEELDLKYNNFSQTERTSIRERLPNCEIEF